MYKVGMSTRTLTEENLLEIKKSGIDAIEVCVPAVENKNINFKELKRKAMDYRKNGGKY